MYCFSFSFSYLLFFSSVVFVSHSTHLFLSIFHSITLPSSLFVIIAVIMYHGSLSKYREFSWKWIFAFYPQFRFILSGRAKKRKKRKRKKKRMLVICVVICTDYALNDNRLGIASILLFVFVCVEICFIWCDTGCLSNNNNDNKNDDAFSSIFKHSL